MRNGTGRHIEFIEENFSRIYPAHLTAFTRLLTQLRAAFDGDLDLLVILAVIGERTRRESWAPELLTYRHLTKERDEEHVQLSINIQSVADFSGIARETVRRKVGVLQKKGWVVRDAEGNLSVSPSAAKDLEGATVETIVYLATILKAVDIAHAERTGRAQSPTSTGKAN